MALAKLIQDKKYALILVFVYFYVSLNILSVFLEPISEI